MPGGIRAELYSIAASHPDIVKLEVIGHTLQGREIIALKVTKDATTVADGTRPDVLYMGTIHAREWIATEVVRRELHYFVDNYGSKASVTNLVNTRELWFMPVANPDGYQYTFDGDRLWRKNLRDNDHDGQITNADGVDLNRNYDIKWGFDDEGSSSQISSETYRGTAPASEPETQAHQALIDRLGFKFLVTYHSYGPLLLYPFGWQIQTPTADDPLYIAYTGTDANPAITKSDPDGAEVDPGVGADLYITNGTTDDYSYTKTGALSWTPELEEGCDGCGFVFPDNEAKIQAAFEHNLPFRARSRQVGSASGESDVPSGKHCGPVLSRDVELRSGEDQQPDQRLPVLGLVRRSSNGPGACQAESGCGDPPLPDQRRLGAVEADSRMEWR
jgi:hypothetical protein